MRLILNPLKSLARPRWLHKYQSVVSSPLPHLKKRDKMEKEGLKNRRVLGSRLLFLSSIVHESLCFSSSRPVLKDWNKETEILKGFSKQVKRERSTSTEKVNPSQGVECKKEWSQTYSWYCWLSGVARIIPVTHKFQIIYIKRATGSADTSCYVILYAVERILGVVPGLSSMEDLLLPWCQPVLLSGTRICIPTFSATKHLSTGLSVKAGLLGAPAAVLVFFCSTFCLSLIPLASRPPVSGEWVWWELLCSAACF